MTDDRARLIQSYEDRLASACEIITTQNRQLASLYELLDPAKQSQFLITAHLRDVREAKR